LGGGILTTLLYIWDGNFVMPSMNAILVSVLFSSFLIFVPYVLYYILSGTYGFKVDIWRKLIFTLVLVYIFQLAFHQEAFQVLDGIFIVLFIGGYYFFTAPDSAKS
jgi:hypothetical protein